MEIEASRPPPFPQPKIPIRNLIPTSPCPRFPSAPGPPPPAAAAAVFLDTRRGIDSRESESLRKRGRRSTWCLGGESAPLRGALAVLPCAF